MSKRVAGERFVPCSPRHRHCSRAHSALVEAYCDERRRQEGYRDEITLGYAGDERRWTDSGGRLITFKEWLIFNRTNKE